MDVIFSHSPHVKSANSTKKIMINVVIALLPAFIMGVVYFGLSALIIVLTAVVSAVLSEIVLNIPFKVVKEGYEDEFSDEEDYEINPSLEALKDLYGGEGK